MMRGAHRKAYKVLLCEPVKVADKEGEVEVFETGSIITINKHGYDQLKRKRRFVLLEEK